MAPQPAFVSHLRFSIIGWGVVGWGEDARAGEVRPKPRWRLTGPQPGQPPITGRISGWLR